jgi:RNA recognition motif-containing protein
MAEFKVFVGNLSYAVTKENLEELFNPIAKVYEKLM